MNMHRVFNKPIKIFRKENKSIKRELVEKDHLNLWEHMYQNPPSTRGSPQKRPQSQKIRTAVSAGSLKHSLSKERPTNVLMEPHNVIQVKPVLQGLSSTASPVKALLKGSGSVKHLMSSKITPSASYLRVEDVDIKEEKTYYSHKSYVNRVKEINEREFVSCSNDSTIKFWKTSQCKEFRSLKVAGYVYSILPLYLEDTHHSLVVISYAFDQPTNGHLSLYDLSKNAVRSRYKNAHTDIIHCIVPLHNLKLKFFATQSRDAEIKIWRTLDLVPIISVSQP